MTTYASTSRSAVTAHGARARWDAGVRTGAATVLWLSLLLVTYWWATGGGISQLTSFATGTYSLGRISGLVASVLLLAQVILMSRLPVLEKAYGQHRLAHLHRLVGFTSINLMLAHIVLITVGYAGGSLSGSVPMLWHLLVSYPGMLLALAGTIALLMVAVTSVKVARRSLRYESWHLLHLYAYLGVGLALPHQLWTGIDFISSPGRTAFWWTAWGVSIGVLVIWRLGGPVRLNLRHRMHVTSVVDEAPGIWSVYVSGKHMDELRVEAGQFFTWRFLGGPGWTRANPYSISAAPDGRSLRITVQGVGDGSHSLRRLHRGTPVLVEGPFGRLSPRARSRSKLAFIGAGVGITPLRALAEALPYRRGEAVYLERYSESPLFAKEIDKLARDRGLTVLRLKGPRRAANSWLPASAGTAGDAYTLKYWVPDIVERDVYVCGPEGWTNAVTNTLARLGVPDDNIHTESFAW